MTIEELFATVTLNTKIGKKYITFEKNPHRNDYFIILNDKKFKKEIGYLDVDGNNNVVAVLIYNDDDNIKILKKSLNTCRDNNIFVAYRRSYSTNVLRCA
jgi:hypothetical protein